MKRIILFLLLGTSPVLASEVNCLASAIHGEAGGEDKRGKLLVAEVVMNRVESDNFPNTVCGVVNQPSQFKPKSVSSSSETFKLAGDVLSGKIKLPETGALYFHSGKRPSSWKKRKLVGSYAGHKFYK